MIETICQISLSSGVVAEVVSIWKDFESFEEIEKSQACPGEDQDRQTVCIEVRWFYDRAEIKGTRSEGGMESDEVLETDHVDCIEAAKSLLSPVMLHDNRDTTSIRKTFLGREIPQLLCRRFWSTTRKSLIPCEKSKGRQRRGWLYSRELPREVQRKLEGRSGPEFEKVPQTKRLPTTWKESMTNTIAKLTLKDASRLAYVDGDSLIGRERELQKLLSFFRSAIRGDPGTGGVKSSMFIAAPPGVGKGSLRVRDWSFRETRLNALCRIFSPRLLVSAQRLRGLVLNRLQEKFQNLTSSH